MVISEGYDRKVQYHNDVHAADVLQTAFFILYNGKIKDKLKLKDVDIFAVLLSAICHDYKHLGLNNIYQINARSDIAIKYNSKIIINTITIIITLY